MLRELPERDGQTVVVVVGPGQGNRVSHYATCPDAKKWRKK